MQSKASQESHLINNLAPYPTVCMDFNSTTMKCGFAGELAPMWHLASQWGEVSKKKADEAEGVVAT